MLSGCLRTPIAKALLVHVITHLLGMALAGRAVLVTGSTDGIGRYTAMNLAQMGAKVLVHGRYTRYK